MISSNNFAITHAYQAEKRCMFTLQDVEHKTRFTIKSYLYHILQDSKMLLNRKSYLYQILQDKKMLLNRSTLTFYCFIHLVSFV